MDQDTITIVGGLSEARPATPEIQRITDKVSQYISEKNLTLKQTFIIWFIIWHGIKSVENNRNQKDMGIVQTFIQLEVKH